MKCALAAVGSIDGDIGYNKAVLTDTIRKLSGKADVVLFGEAFLQGFHAIDFTVEHDRAVSIFHEDRLLGEICDAAKDAAVAVSFGFLEKEGDSFFSSQITIDKSGQIVDLYRRVSPGWKEAYAGKEYREGDGFHTFRLLGKAVAVGLCGDLWYDENIARLNALKPDLVFWPVYTDYDASVWNRTAKLEYAEQAGKIDAPVFYVNSVCTNTSVGREIAKGGAALFEGGAIKEELPAGSEGILIVEA